MHDLSPTQFCAELARLNIQRLSLTWDSETDRLVASHPELQPFADHVAANKTDFDQHEGLFFQVAPDTGVLQCAFVHRTCRGQAAGGLRYWTYDTIDDVIKDGIRLARGMTRKNALAGIWWGGGKGIMVRNTGVENRDRQRVYEEYGAFITSLAGCYVTAEDVGTTVTDMTAVYSQTRFTTCIPAHLGGSGNPSKPTARGVVRGMEAALHHLGMGTLQGKTVAMQGVGNVGRFILADLAERGVSRVIAADVNPDNLARAQALGLNVELETRLCEPGDASILFEDVDVVAPCATGACLNPDTISQIRAPIICGAANNQLEDTDRDGALLQEKGVLFMPDFLVNRMGIVNCADEQYGYVGASGAFEKHLGEDWENGIYRLSLDVLAKADAARQSPAVVARALADERSKMLHPIWGHRGQAIIARLARAGWSR
ncbi:MAG: leucine dehydrogenase [Rhodobacterales bacterium]|nr:leucine dehydrogenase [Rhodobacterales bacterium]